MSHVRYFFVFLREGPFFLKYGLYLRCEDHSEFNLHSVFSSCVTISSCVVIPHCIGISLYGASLLVLVVLHQSEFSQTETHVYCEKVRHKITTKTKPVEKGGHCPLVHTALWRAPHAFEKWAEWHDDALWEMGCEEDSDYHQVVGDGVSGQDCGTVCQVRVVESQVRVIERAEKRSTPQC